MEPFTKAELAGETDVGGVEAAAAGTATAAIITGADQAAPLMIVRRETGPESFEDVVPSAIVLPNQFGCGAGRLERDGIVGITVIQTGTGACVASVSFTAR